MAFHPQTDGETERVNQELEQYLHVFGNFQQDNWAELIPFMEFAHNARQHSATTKSPFKVWYGFKPEFIPPVNFATKIPTVEECLCTLDQVRTEVTAALKVAAEVMKRSKVTTATHVFKPGDQVWLEGTNVHTTHPKAKLAPRRHGPSKVLSTWGINVKLQLPKTWRIHPVFHTSLISPYKETPAHGPNFTRPPPEIIQGEPDHYEVEAVLQSKISPNKKGILYLIKWKGYPHSENSWLPASQMNHARLLVQQFHTKNPWAPKPTNLRVLSAQHSHKEGILSQTCTSARDGPPRVKEVQGIALRSPVKPSEGTGWIGPSRMTRAKTLDKHLPIQGLPSLKPDIWSHSQVTHMI